MARFRVDDSAAYDRTAKQRTTHLYRHDTCCVCGRPMSMEAVYTTGDWLLLCRDGSTGDVYAIETIADAAQITSFGPQSEKAIYIQPIGKDCLRKHPEYLGALVGRRPAHAS